ncbi:C4-dicarboxylate ABC transporter substrate-binding protein [Actinomadura sp. NBRC 104412]|uniref:TAXI family TRAP transporter solute-binding subunit n=1 Tax=Actinomadura sp. NBRC 104412 TaxID=3032203 RepID=UPI0024A01ACE|nr:TAXI family TRAP transporter solute-binding subunit [Actinomadura sp. NBRC 104412]GLZ02785.1 C4-dicarboxylate ABC transporter substrate-binding protein [Actinomadura sp. NBRC 104412]
MRTILRSRAVLATLALTTTLGLTACGGEHESDEGGLYNRGRLSIATGDTTGVYYQLGGGYADVISKNVRGYQATAEATGASIENIQRVVRGDSDIAFTLADVAGEAATGKHSFDSPQPIRALARIYNNYVHVIARTDSGIRSVADMRGKRVSTGSPNSGTEAMAVRLLEAAGINPKSGIRRQALSLPETVQGMKDGTIDAMVWSGGLPTSGITDLMTTVKTRAVFVPLRRELPKLQARYGQIYQPTTIRRNVYRTPGPVSTILVPNVLIVSPKMPDNLAFELAKVIFDRRQDLVRVHPEAENIDKAQAAKTEPIPLHPGARRYYFGG